MIQLTNRQRNCTIVVSLMFFVLAQLVAVQHSHAHKMALEDGLLFSELNASDVDRSLIADDDAAHSAGENLCAGCFLVLAKDWLVQGDALSLSLLSGVEGAYCAKASGSIPPPFLFAFSRAPPSYEAVS